MTDTLRSLETPSVQTLPPHFRCDCVPDLGPAHCHRCSRTAATPVDWKDSVCKPLVETFAYTVLLVAHADASLLLISEAFDAEQADVAALAAMTAWAAENPVPILRPESQVVAPVAPVTPVATAHLSVVPAPPKNRLVLISAQERYEQTTAPGAWRFTNLARDQIRSLGHTERDVVEILENAHVKTPSHSGTAINHYGGGLLMMVDVDGECVISVIERDTPIEVGKTDSSTSNPTGTAALTMGAPVKQKPHSGGAGRRMPSNVREFLSMLSEHGFVTELGGKGHHLTMHPRHPEVRISVASSPSDNRSYKNTIADIKRRTGIDITTKKD